MTATIIDGKAIAAQVRAEVAQRVKALTEQGTQPGLAAILVGDHAASAIYVGMKQKACAEAGILSERVDLPGDVPEAEVLAEIDRLNKDPRISGIIVQLPVPDHVSEFAVQQAIDPAKDVDGLNPTNVGFMGRGHPVFLPATPFGIVELLVRSDVTIEGADVCVVGRGDLVGMPLAIMLAQRHDRANATVTICHTRTRDIASHTSRADIVIAAAGKAEMITADMVKPGATVIDVGTNRAPGGGLVGDVHFESVKEIAGAITPVPGGVGPMTVAMLLVNTVTAAERQAAER
ncbi:MAG TPA: bifunctional 5,10-methylenetetrahydrofolate dehydrogenase/5,10-methenyltetrahydrofolate cyclohydrolase [Actinomycetota bacterium]|nr:bifunctional 5,10-methylenetetrahydrofolate dehydrogenase/5,10-methenyltetrahydrofolate cyclohydrolase [Actinomycetota bacterium]